MFLYRNRIVITGGAGRFGLELKKIKSKYKFFFPKKKWIKYIKNKIYTKLLEIKET